MKIGIDARLIEETGVGRYIRNLISQLGDKDHMNEYVIFLRRKSFLSFVPPNARWKKVLADVPWHTVQEQIVMPKLFNSETLDIVHIPYHNPPIFYGGKMVITIHDLTILHFNTGKATTLPMWMYELKRLGYWVELAVGMRRAQKIIAVSQTTKKEIVAHFRVPEEKICVTYEGVDRNLSATTSKRLIAEPYYLYVGNAYPHKNLDILFRAPLKNKVMFVGADDYFYRHLKNHLSDNVLYFGKANDQQLANLYTNAVAFIFPSRMEGFGLPALEALSFGCPVVVSDIPVFHEILGEYATYFDPKDPQSLITALANIKKPNPALISKFLLKYSWKHMASQTLNLYEDRTRI